MRLFGLLMIMCFRANALEICTMRNEALNCDNIDVCVESNSFFNRWHHLENGLSGHLNIPMVNFSSYDSNKAHNFFNIARVTPDRGINLLLCEPDFSVLRALNNYVCQSNSIQKISCLDSCSPITVNNSRIQMARFDFQTGWGCFEAADVTPGFEIKPDIQTPNFLQSCTIPTHSTAAVCNAQDVNCCGFDCNEGFVREVDVCVANCNSSFQTTCSSNEKTISTCVQASQTLHKCEPCPHTGGFSVNAWSSRANKLECSYTECLGGTYDDGMECRSCPANHYSLQGASECIACSVGKLSEVGSTQCVSCFESPSRESADDYDCVSGEELSRNVTYTIEYLQEQNIDEALINTFMRQFCTNDHACLPCAPGTYENSKTCELCSLGKYQPNYQHTSCFDCAQNQTTKNLGSHSREECLCEAGTE